MSPLLPRSNALAHVTAVGAGFLVAATSAWSSTCGDRVRLEAEYYVTPVTDKATCVAAGDWNEDGRADLAVVHEGSTLTTLLGRGDYQVGSRREFPLDIVPSWIVARDMDGDGHQDLVVTGTGGTVVLSGDGAGAFRGSERYPESGSHVYVGELDGDGKPDIVLGAFSTPITVRFRGSGEILRLIGGRNSAALADFDRDGDVDLASSGGSAVGSAILVWFNDGHGGFSAPASHSIHCSSPYIAAGDLNGDGNADLVGVAQDGGFGGCDMVLLGRGDGTFQGSMAADLPRSVTPPTPIRPARPIESESGPEPGEPFTEPPQSPRHIPPGPHFVMLVDVNGDGRDEHIRIGGDTGHELNGRRSLWPVMACAADMNQDGMLDMAMLGSRAIAIHPGKGDGTFRYNAGAWISREPEEVHMADLDQDGRRDVAWTGSYGELVVVLSAEDGGIKRVIQNQIWPSSGSIALADFDGDGLTDLLSAEEGVYLGNGDGTFRAPPIAGEEWWNATPGDFNEDGHVDVATAQVDRVRIAFGNGDGTFRTGTDIAVKATKLSAMDVDHDGHLDLLASAGNAANILYGRGDGTPAEIVAFPAQGGSWDLSWGDFDGDQLLDVVGPGAGGATMYLSRGRTLVPAGLAGAPFGSAVGDMDGDGFLDLVGGSISTAWHPAIWFGRGDGTFEAGVGPFGPGGRMLLDDRDGDGLSDIVVVGTYDEDGYLNTLSLIPNRTVRNVAPVTSGARASIAHAWPPNGDLVDVAIEGVTDPDGDPVTISCLAVTQDEPVTTNAKSASETGPSRRANGCADALITPDGHARVRLKRDGGGNGRVYVITFEASDGCGGSGTGQVEVHVPHDPGRECVNDGQSYNSLACGSGSALHSAGAELPPLSVVRSAGRAWAIRYALAAPAEVRLELFDLAGRRIADLDSGFREAGDHAIEWTPVPHDGVFFVRLTMNGTRNVRRFVVFR